MDGRSANGTSEYRHRPRQAAGGREMGLASNKVAACPDCGQETSPGAMFEGFLSNHHHHSRGCCTCFRFRGFQGQSRDHRGQQSDNLPPTCFRQGISVAGRSGPSGRPVPPARWPSNWPGRIPRMRAFLWIPSLGPARRTRGITPETHPFSRQPGGYSPGCWRSSGECSLRQEPRNQARRRLQRPSSQAAPTRVPWPSGRCR